MEVDSDTKRPVAKSSACEGIEGVTDSEMKSSACIVQDVSKAVSMELEPVVQLSEHVTKLSVDSNIEDANRGTNESSELLPD